MAARERAVVRILELGITESRLGRAGLIAARRDGGFTRRTLYQAFDLRNRALGAMFGVKCKDNGQPLWPYLSREGRAKVMERALEMARGPKIHPDEARRRRREARRRSMSPAVAAVCALEGELGWAFACVMAAALCADSMVWMRRCTALIDEVHEAKDEARTARIEQSRLQSVVRSLAQSGDHEDAILEAPRDADGHLVPPPLPPPPEPGSLESDRLRQRSRRRRVRA